MRKDTLSMAQRFVLQSMMDGASLHLGPPAWLRGFSVNARTVDILFSRGLIAVDKRKKRRGFARVYRLTPAGRAALQGEDQ